MATKTRSESHHVARTTATWSGLLVDGDGHPLRVPPNADRRRAASCTLSFADAASLPLTAITAWEALCDHLGLGADSRGTLLVVGASGGVGSIMLQLVRALLPGVSAVATASDPERVETGHVVGKVVLDGWN